MASGEDVCPGTKKLGKKDFIAARELLASSDGTEYWRSLQELAGDPEFKEQMHREFPKGASEWLDPVSRRGFLKLAGASIANTVGKRVEKGAARLIRPA